MTRSSVSGARSSILRGSALSGEGDAAHGLADHQLELRVEALASEALRLAVLGVGVPGGLRLLGGELDHGDALAVFRGEGLERDEARLPCGELGHALAPALVLGAGLATQTIAKQRDHQVASSSFRRCSVQARSR